MLILQGRAVKKEVDIRVGWTILDHAKAHDVDFGFHCTRGTCARCRSLIVEGGELLAEPTKAERERMDEEEFVDGYRLACQAKLVSGGRVIARNKPYF